MENRSDCIEMASSVGLPLCEACHSSGNFCSSYQYPVMEPSNGFAMEQLLADAAHVPSDHHTSPRYLSDEGQSPDDVISVIRRRIEDIYRLETWAAGGLTSLIQFIGKHVTHMHAVADGWKDRMEHTLRHSEAAIISILRHRSLALPPSSTDEDITGRNPTSMALLESSNLVDIASLQRRAAYIESRMVEADLRERGRCEHSRREVMKLLSDARHIRLALEQGTRS